MTGYSLADLTTLTRAKRRSVQLWAEAGVLQAATETERAGTGVHRRFSRDEAVVALLISPFADTKITIGVLKVLANHFREHLNTRRDLFEAAIANQRQVYLLASSYNYSTGIQTTVYDLNPEVSFADRMAALGAQLQDQLEAGGSAITLYLNRHLAPLRA